MLELRPACEHCRKRLPPESHEAMICSYECTFCRTCVDAVLHGVCPNCGGGFCARPVRPGKDWVGGNCLANHPPGEREVYKPVDPARHARLLAAQNGLPPQQR